MTDFLSPWGLLRNYNHFQWQTANLQANKRETLNVRVFSFFFPVKRTFKFIRLVHTHTQTVTLLQLIPKFSCHLSLWHKSESKDLYNGWRRRCKLVSPCFLSSHWACKHPLPTETHTERRQSSQTLPHAGHNTTEDNTVGHGHFSATRLFA